MELVIAGDKLDLAKVVEALRQAGFEAGKR